VIDWVIGSCMLIVAVFGIRGLFRGRISCMVRYALWGVVVIRLLCPVGIWESDTAFDRTGSVWYGEAIPGYQGNSEYTKLPVQTGQEEQQGNPEQDKMMNGIVPGDEIQTGDDSEVRKVSPGKESGHMHLYSILDDIADRAGVIFRKVWLIGAVIGLLWVAAVNVRFGRTLKQCRKKLSDGGGDVKAEVYLAENLETPCLFGMFHPAIYVTPEVIEDEKTLEMVLAHENCHYLHKDQFWVMIRGVCIAVWWWNPLVWAAANAMRTDCEQACDEHVMKKIGYDQRYVYGEALIRVASGRKGRYNLVASTMASEKDDVKGRLQMIMKRHKVYVVSMLLAVLMTVFAAVVCFGESESSSEPEVCVEDIMVSISMDMAELMAKKADKSYMEVYTADEKVQQAVEPFKQYVEAAEPEEVYLYQTDEKLPYGNPAEEVISDQELIFYCTRAFATMINSQSGVYMLAASSVLTESAVYLCPDGMDGIWAVELAYPENVKVFVTFYANEHGTMEVTATPMFSSDESLNLKTYLENGDYLGIGVSCEKTEFDMSAFEDDAEIRTAVEADKVGSGDDELISLADGFAKQMQERILSEAYAEIMGMSEMFIGELELCSEKFGEEPAAAVIWEMNEYDEVLESLSEYAGDEELVKESFTVERMVTMIPNLLLGNTSGAEKLAAAGMIRTGASYQADDDAVTKMVWLIYGDAEAGDAIICAVTFAVNDNGCMTANATPMWLNGAVTGIIDVCMEGRNIEFSEETADRDEQEIIIDWLSTGEYVPIAEK